MFLDRILAGVQERGAERERVRPRREVERAAADAPEPRGFAHALAAAPGGIGLIAELKKASPSAGLLRPDFDVPALAAAYARGGACCLSVLTETGVFQGDLEHLGQAAGADLPLLQKDFLLSEYQILEGRAAGADAVLLVAEGLESNRMQELCRLSLDLGMDVLCEAHDPKNLRRVASLAEQQSDRILIGINNRDLHTFAVTLEVSERALRELPHEFVLVSESGIRTAEDVFRLRAAGARGILVGETLLRASDVEKAARDLMSRVVPRDSTSGSARGEP